MDIRRIITPLSIVVIVISIGLVVWSLYITQTTGILRIQTTDKNAVISISQTNSSAKIIGRGNTSVHLKVGFYQVAASNNSRQAFAAVQINKKGETKVSLNPVSSQRLPSIETINFSGLDAFVDHGLSSSQVNSLKQSFFLFKPTANSVTVDQSSIKPGPHNPDTDVGFKTVFEVKIDSVNYKGTLSYFDLNSVRLYLYTVDTNQLVYDSNSAP